MDGRTPKKHDTERVRFRGLAQGCVVRIGVQARAVYDGCAVNGSKVTDYGRRCGKARHALRCVNAAACTVIVVRAGDGRSVMQSTRTVAGGYETCRAIQQET